jgi:hypothetical protein
VFKVSLVKFVLFRPPLVALAIPWHVVTAFDFTCVPGRQREAPPHLCVGAFGTVRVRRRRDLDGLANAGLQLIQC